MIESILLTATRISTFHLQQPLTNASGFFFARDGRDVCVLSQMPLKFKPISYRNHNVHTR